MAHTPALDRLWRWLRGSETHAASPSTAKAHASHAGSSGLRQQRSTRREQLFALVRENMIRLGVLSSHYKFKVLTLDPAGEQFIVMVDWQASAPTAEPSFEKSYEAGLQHLMEERRLGFKVKAVYWRGHVTTAPAAAVQAATPVNPAPARTPPVAPKAAATPPPATDHDVSEDEIQAFQAALREAGGGSRATRKPPPLSPQDMPDFEPTINTDDKPGTEFGSLSETQYGKLS
ncbi:hypothetical protein [Hydrogenophaga sp. OTU3427]|uniref:hypothetical protein n=1 Tax=Hydrogenophaga sp. OTU3427 TaxID=3043856 RepID=UPI00313AE181